MKDYKVRIWKCEVYYVEAENEKEAIELACYLCDKDEDAFNNPADEIYAEEM